MKRALFLFSVLVTHAILCTTVFSYTTAPLPLTNDALDITFDNFYVTTPDNTSHLYNINTTDTNNVSMIDNIFPSGSSYSLTWKFYKANIVDHLTQTDNHTINLPTFAASPTIPDTLNGSCLELKNGGFIENKFKMNKGVAYITFNYCTSEPGIPVNGKLMYSTATSVDDFAVEDWEQAIRFSTENDPSATGIPKVYTCKAKIYVQEDMFFQFRATDTKNGTSNDYKLYIDNIQINYCENNLSNQLTKPENFQIDNYYPTKVSFTWDAVTNANAYYLITHQDDIMGNEENDTVMSLSNSYNWTGLNPTQSYGIQVFAAYDETPNVPTYYDSPLTNILYFRTPTGAPIATPIHLHSNPSNAERTAAQVTWEPVNLAAEYRIEYALESNEETIYSKDILQPNNSTTIKYVTDTITGLTANTHYLWRVQAHVNTDNLDEFDPDGTDFTHFYDSDFSEWFHLTTVKQSDAIYYNNKNVYNTENSETTITLPVEPDQFGFYFFLGWTNNPNFSLTGTANGSNTDFNKLINRVYANPGDTLLYMSINPPADSISIATDGETINKDIKLYAIWGKELGTYNSGSAPIFFSSYLQSNGFNSGFEIFNSSNSAINLADYVVKIYYNGSTTPATYFYPQGILNSHDTYTIVNPNAATSLQNKADTLDTNSTIYSGNDAITLNRIDTEELLDIIGEIGQAGNNGASQTHKQFWTGTDAFGSTINTQDELLTRSSIVTNGNPVFTYNEWVGKPDTDYPSFGSHTFTSNHEDITIKVDWSTDLTIDKKWEQKDSITDALQVSNTINCNNVIIEGNNKIEYSGNMKANSLILHSEDDDMPSFRLRNGGTIDIEHTITFHKTITDNSRWYYISLPYDCKISEVYEENGIHGYTTDWLMKDYNSVRRAQGYFDSSNWSVIAEGTLLKANKGYAIASSKATPIKLIFPPTSDVQTTSDLTLNDTIAVTYTPVSSDGTEVGHSGYDDGWVFIGNPFLFQMESSFVNFTTNANNIAGYYTPVWDLNNSIYNYVVHPYTNNSLMPFRSYFLQLPNDVSEVLYSYNEVVSAPEKPSNRTTGQLNQFEIALSNSANLTDYSTISLKENYNETYEMGNDLLKMLTKGSRPQLYSITDRKQAIIALCDTTMDTIHLGYYAASNDTYTFKLNYSNYTHINHLYLTDKVTYITTDLLAKEYSFTSLAGSFEDRFIITYNNENKEPVNLNTSKSNGPVVYNCPEGICIESIQERTEIKVFDSTGKVIYHRNNDDKTIIPISIKGVYTIQLNNTRESLTIKAII